MSLFVITYLNTFVISYNLSLYIRHSHTERLTDNSTTMAVRRGHVLLLPYPSQGHINPLLQFGKRLAHHGLDVALATTRYIVATTTPEPGPIKILPMSDGFDEGGYAAAGDIPTYLNRLESAGSETLTELIELNLAQGKPIDVLVYDAFLPWALDVGKRFGITCAAFFTQSCAVGAVYCHVRSGLLAWPAEESVELPGLPRLEPEDLPSFLTEPVPRPYTAYFELVLNQFSNLDDADVVLFNSCYELEKQELDWLKTTRPVSTIGPTIPSAYIDNQITSDTHYGFNLYTSDISCIAWLDSQAPNSVVYVAYGSLSFTTPEQMEEIARALQNINRNFLWVVRASEVSKLPKDFIKETSERGLVVPWSPQLEVLAHPSIGCFVTHCGWNSTTEALCLAVPMVGVPQWTDQQTNAKYVKDVWEVGVRVNADVKGFVRREEMERCIRDVMEGEKSKEMKKNAKKWSEIAKAAVSEGGSSNKNILEFVEKYCS